MLSPRCTLLALAVLATTSSAQQAPRTWTFMDQQLLRQVASPALSPDGTQLLYALSVPDWKEAKRFTDLYLVSTRDGVGSTRRLTFTNDRNETSPRWAPDGSFFVFASNRDAAAGATTQQLYLMRPDGGEARRITDAKDGVGAFAFSKDGKWIAFSAGKTGEQQIMALSLADIDTARARSLTRHTTPVGWWRISNDGQRLYFVAADSVDRANKERMDRKFDVRIRNQDIPLNHLWVVDIATGAERRLTQGDQFSVEGVTLSDDGKWAGIRAYPNDRYARTSTEGGNHSDLYLLDLSSGTLERLTNNTDIGESALSFAPDGKTIAFSASDDFKYFRASKVYTRAIAATGTPFTKLGGGYDGDVSIGWWSDDSRTIYFNDGVRATNQLLALDVASNTVKQLTDLKAALSVQKDDESGKILIQYSDPKTPTIHFVVDRAEDVVNRASWRQVTDANPHVASMLLGEEEEICWKSVDRKTTCGILVKPVGYAPGKRYPLIVAIHGGPQSADILTFNGGYGAQAYAGDGYMVLKPNYRGSTNYGEAHKWGIVNDYFRKGYEDIMTGVDKLIADGLVDGDRMGVLGWSAGGHWTNWIITHTTRFKAASSGAGTANWISMYAQSDMQDVRANYLGGKPPYDDFEAYWKQSPIRYIKNAKTPTMIHVVDGDPRVPRPQSDELYMGLRKAGVPTEYFVYPGNTHGIPDARNQLLKSVAEKAWMDHWILGKGKFQWKDVLKTLEDSTQGPKATTTPRS